MNRALAMQQGFLRFFDECFSGAGEAHLSLGSVKKADSKFVFKLANLLKEGWETCSLSAALLK